MAIRSDLRGGASAAAAVALALLGTATAGAQPAPSPYACTTATLDVGGDKDLMEGISAELATVVQAASLTETPADKAELRLSVFGTVCTPQPKKVAGVLFYDAIAKVELAVGDGAASGLAEMDRKQALCARDDVLSARAKDETSRDKAISTARDRWRAQKKAELITAARAAIASFTASHRYGVIVASDPPGADFWVGAQLRPGGVVEGGNRVATPFTVSCREQGMKVAGVLALDGYVSQRVDEKTDGSATAPHKLTAVVINNGNNNGNGNNTAPDPPPVPPKKESTTLQWILAFSFGAFFVLFLLIVVLLVPNPTSSQMLIFRPVQAMSLAGVAAVVPGFLEFSSSGTLIAIRAGGAVGVFVLVYLVNPARLVKKSTGRARTGNDR